MAGRKPKPTAIKELEGNPGKRKLNNKEPKHFATVGITVAELPVKDLGTGSECKMLDTGKNIGDFQILFLMKQNGWKQFPFQGNW